MLGFYTIVGIGLTSYMRIAKGSNNLWLIGGFAPLASAMLYNWARQPQTELDNCYSYLLARRAATCELESNMARYQELESTKTKEFEGLSTHLAGNNTTLFQMEAHLLQSLAAKSS